MKLICGTDNIRPQHSEIPMSLYTKICFESKGISWTFNLPIFKGSLFFPTVRLRVYPWGVNFTDYLELHTTFITILHIGKYYQQYE